MKKSVVSIICIILTFHQLAFAADFRFSPRPNKAHLIQWRTWSQESLQEAKKMNRPILLSLSAVWCHWCHVMDETTYSDPAVIAFINKNFIPVRVDADRRPDIDNLYNQGGWPSTVVLTPEGEVMQGGTYILPDEMLPWLSKTVHIFKEGKQQRNETSEERGKASPQGTKGISPDGTELLEIIGLIKSSFDDKYGGFGTWQKFPNPDAIDLLLAEYLKKRDPDLKAIIARTLDHMAAGEIYDAVEGGFFRYATRPDWSGPHYEKMLDTNAGLIRNYASAYMVLGESTYRKIMLGDMHYVMTTLFDRKAGVFYGSQDAGEEYYKEKQRKGLKPPAVDKTVYADSNARMITALLAAYDATGNREYLRVSRKTAAFIARKLYTAKDGVYHYYLGRERHTSGLLSDNVLFGLALIDLYNATGERNYIRLADAIAHLVIDRFYDHKKRQFILSPGTTLVTPSATSALLDAHTTIANYRAAILLSRLYHYQKNEGLKKIVDDTLAGFTDTTATFSFSSTLRYSPAVGPWRAGCNHPHSREQQTEQLFDKIEYGLYSGKGDENLLTQTGQGPDQGRRLCPGRGDVSLRREEMLSPDYSLR
jgi:uncharacterized protein YyaL (SSP411 family)